MEEFINPFSASAADDEHDESGQRERSWVQSAGAVAHNSHQPDSPPTPPVIARYDVVGDCQSRGLYLSSRQG